MLQVFAYESDKPRPARQARQQRFEIQIAIADVKSEHAISRQLVEVQIHRLGCQKMRGYRVRAEGVHDQQSISASGRFTQSQTRVAEDHTIMGLHAVAQKREVAR